MSLWPTIDHDKIKTCNKCGKNYYQLYEFEAFCGKCFNDWYQNQIFGYPSSKRSSWNQSHSTPWEPSWAVRKIDHK